MEELVVRLPQMVPRCVPPLEHIVVLPKATALTDTIVV